MELKIQVPKVFLVTLNQVYEIEQKLIRNGDPSNLLRNIEKLKDAFAHNEGFGLIYENPKGQPFNETRIDVEASISGKCIEDLIIVEVIKPIIRVVIHEGSAVFSKIIQKGIVIVESRKEQVTNE